MAAVSADVTPKLLAWAREASGYTRDEAAKRVAVKATKLADWESGNTKPSFTQAVKLATIYKRPLALFYLQEPPIDPRSPRDFRSKGHAPDSPALRLAYRRAHDRRRVTLELREALGLGAPAPFELTATRSDDARALAARMREVIGITLKDQRAWKSAEKAVSMWRAAIEGLGVLVLFARRIETAETRGFSLAEDSTLPVIVVNGSDAPAGRVFTLFHELAHVLLRDGGVCDLQGGGVEEFCNAFAGEFLVPRDDLLEEPEVRARAMNYGWPSDDLQTLARRYSVSEEVILRRLVTLNRASKTLYENRRDGYVARRARNVDDGKSSGPPPEVMSIHDNSEAFARLVVDAYRGETISLAEAGQLLEVPAARVAKVEEKLWRR